MNEYMYGNFANDVKELEKNEVESDCACSMTAITISKERYEQLVEAEEWAVALEQAGVDNWEGYDLAKDIYATFN